MIVTGLGHVVGPDCDSSAFLKTRKSRKFMGCQDELAVIAAGRALQDAGLSNPLGETAGLYLAVGYIPFNQSDMEGLVAGGADEHGFSMRSLSTTAYENLNPLLTFRCLSNMPAYHISVNFGIEGPYFVTYPGPGQFYLALQQARHAIETGLIEIALVAGVAHQQNFLVEHHFSRIHPPATSLLDAAGCLILESEEHARQRNARTSAQLRDCRISYQRFDPYTQWLAPSETGADCAMGPASLPVSLSIQRSCMLDHHLQTRDGLTAASRWEIA